MVTLMHQNVIDYDFVNDVWSTKKFNFVTLHVVVVDAQQPPYFVILT